HHRLPAAWMPARSFSSTCDRQLSAVDRGTELTAPWRLTLLEIGAELADGHVGLGQGACAVGRPRLVPQPHCRVVASGGEQFAVRTERQPPDLADVAFQG